MVRTKICEVIFWVINPYGTGNRAICLFRLSLSLYESDQNGHWRLKIDSLGYAWIMHYGLKPIVLLKWWERLSNWWMTLSTDRILYKLIPNNFAYYFSFRLCLYFFGIPNDRARHVTYETVIANSEAILQKEEMSLSEKQLNTKMNFQLVKHWLPSSSLLLLEVVWCNFSKFSNQLLLRFNQKWKTWVSFTKKLANNPLCPTGFDTITKQHIIEKKRIQLKWNEKLDMLSRRLRISN